MTVSFQRGGRVRQRGMQITAESVPTDLGFDGPKNRWFFGVDAS